MAEALAGKLLEKKFGPNSNISVNSAGLAAFPGDVAAAFAVQVMAGEGIDLSDHRAALLTEENVREADLILTMTRAHSEQVNSLFPGSDEKVFLLADFAGHGGDVPDPVGQTLETYRQCAHKLKEMIIKVLDKLV